MKVSDKAPAWIIGLVPAGMGSVPVVSTTLSLQDRLGTYRARWGFRRMHYRVEPGLYAVGRPDEDSPVLATANYKLTFDVLRNSLQGIDAWILVLDTKGINVWCAAGKGTFGTDELVKRIVLAGLSFVVNHRTIILPQLSAPGVAAHEVAKKSGLKVVYGPVRAPDIPRFLENGLKADPGMRTVSFTLRERLAVVPIELVQSWKVALGAFLFWLLSWYAGDSPIFPSVLAGFLPYVAAILAGSLLVPAMLPWIPGRSLAFKGWLAGLAVTLLFLLPRGQWTSAHIAYLLMLPAMSSFLALNFTGATPYTSLSGVMKEMRIATPLLGGSALSGIILHLCGLWRIV